MLSRALVLCWLLIMVVALGYLLGPVFALILVLFLAFIIYPDFLP